jgi:HEAT repeat protein
MGNFLDRGREPSMALSDSCRTAWQDAELLGWRWEEGNPIHRNEAKASQITELADSADISKIRNQIPDLVEKGGIISLVMLLKSIEDKDDYTRCIAAEGLGKFSDPAAVNALINSLKDASSAVRKQSALALGGVGGIRSRPYLIDALKDEDRSVRKAAKKSLFKINISR